MKDDHMRIPRERKVTMGYFDDAKASREEENTLEHSSGAWKKHKYIQKIGEGASAVYKYSKKNITGSYYKDEAEKEEARRDQAERQRDFETNGYKYYKDLEKEYGDDAKEMEETYRLNKSKGNMNDTVRAIGEGSAIKKYLANEYGKAAQKSAKSAQRYADEERHYKAARDKATSDYYTKSLAGKSAKTVARGKALIKDFFTPKTKVTASSNLTGKETIKPKPAEKVTLKKNKLSFKKK